MIRYAAHDDLASIVEIYNSSIPGRSATADLEPVSLDSRREWFSKHRADRHPLWVFDRNSKVVGWLSLAPFYGRPAYSATAEMSVYVAPEYHRQGIAAALLSEALARAPSLGLRAVLGFLFAHNLPSLNLFHKFGFQDWGHLPEVAELDGVRRDVLILGCQVP